jgi:hypothetical protein
MGLIQNDLADIVAQGRLFAMARTHRFFHRYQL